MEIVIEKNVPIKDATKSYSAGLSDVMKKMEVGDSFLFPKKHRDVLNGHAYNAGVKIMQRKVDDEQIRVWRVL